MAWQDKCSSWRSRILASRHDEELNDVEFAVGVIGRVVRANRAILAMASPVMKAQFYGPLSDENKNIIPITDEMGTSRGFLAMIDFIYNQDKYSIKDLLHGKEEITIGEDLKQVMELLFFGDKYQVKSLISFCRNLLIHKIKLDRGNMFSMYNVISNYTVLDVDYQIVTSQIKVFESRIIDIRIFSNVRMMESDRLMLMPFLSRDSGSWKPNIYQIKFKVNQNALLVFDEDKQNVEFHEACQEYHDKKEHHDWHFKSISWEPDNGCREIAKGTKIKTTKFYVKANIENTLQLEVCKGDTDDFGTFGFAEFTYKDTANLNGKFITDNFEIEVIEMNGNGFMEAMISNEQMPMSVLSFQPLMRVV